MDVSLVVVEGRPAGKVIRLKPGRFLIGRDERCQLRPKSATVSQHHCAITRRGSRTTVEDLGSSNGTLVNDHFLEQGQAVELHDGDRLQVGQLIFAVRIGDGSMGSGSGHDAHQVYPSHGPQSDPRGRTVLLTDLDAAGPPGGLGSGPTGRVGAPAASPATFAYREFHSAARAVSLGVSALQLTDEAEVRAMRAALCELESCLAARRMIIDLGEVELLPSLAIAALGALAVRCRKAGGEVRFCRLGPALKRLMAALKLDGVAGCYPDRDAALAAPWEARPAR